jgi:type II secretory pathway pseudopilin PulG
MANYTLIGGDQKQYGPVTTEQLRQWILDGRLNPQSQAKAESDAEWRPLSAFPEFAPALAARSAASDAPPPPLPSTAPTIPANTNGLAVTSLVLGILGLPTCGVTALFGLIFGVMAMVKAKQRRNGIALAGVVVSTISLVMMLIIIAMLLPALAAAKQRAQTINCVLNEQQLAMAVKLYSGAHDGQFPPAATWCDAIKADIGSEKNFKCVAANSSSRCDYAFNAKLGGMEEAKVALDTVMIFESDGGWNANGGPELMIGKPRHDRQFVVAFADGSIRQLRESQLSTLRWDP